MTTRTVGRPNAGLAGNGLLQSQEEWGARGEALVSSLSELALTFMPNRSGRCIDVGCQKGELTDQFQRSVGRTWVGIDPIIRDEEKSTRGCTLSYGVADEIPYPDSSFDCAALANVFEHIEPARRVASLAELRRVLVPGGVVVGQIPNPYFPIESHSRLPFMGVLPQRVQRRYWALSPVPWELDFFRVTMRHIGAAAAEASLRVEYKRPFNYPAEAIPRRVRRIARAAEPVLRHYPWAWQFVLRASR